AVWASAQVARFAAKQGRSDAELLAGIPGTVGGALAMNAGCYGGETWRFVARVGVLNRGGNFEVRTPADYAIGYRSVRWAPTLAAALGNDAAALPPKGESLAPWDGPAALGREIFTAGWFRFPQGDADAARDRIRELLARRILT